MVAILTLLPIIVGFVALSGLLAMLDAAILSVAAAEVEELVAKKKWGAMQLKSVFRHRTRAIIIIVVFTNVTNIAGPMLIGHRATVLFGSVSIGLITAILTIATILFSEIIPKAIGAHYAPTISRFVSPLLLLLIFLLFPLVRTLEMLTYIFKRGKRKVGTEEQIKALAHIGGGAGHIQADESELIRRTFILNDRRTADIMTPLAEIVGMPADRTVRLAARMTFHSVYSRYPVYGKTMDDIRGYVLSRDILEALADGQDNEQISTVSRKILVVPQTMTAGKLLELFRRKQVHIAVVKERKRTVGVVTLEDVLEELVGEIEDEGDAK